MLEAPYHYIVRYWIAPAAEARVLAWLDGGHTAEVDSLGWRAFCSIYGLESKAALDAYFKNPIREKFAREAAAFADVMRAERSWGAAEWETRRSAASP